MADEQDWPFDQPPDAAAITVRTVLDGAPILLVSHDADDDGWQFLDGGEVDLDKAALISMAHAVALDPTVREVADMPPGWTAWRSCSRRAVAARAVAVGRGTDRLREAWAAGPCPRPGQFPVHGNGGRLQRPVGHDPSPIPPCSTATFPLHENSARSSRAIAGLRAHGWEFGQRAGRRCRNSRRASDLLVTAD
jgi:hypothetical protein